MARSEPVEKSFCLFRKRPSLTPQQFRDHWLHKHAALLLSLPEFVERRCDYVQNHVAGSGPRGDAPFPYDGVAQVCVRRGAAELPTFPLKTAYRDRIIPDEEKFIDRANSIVFTTREHIVIDGQGPCKLLIFPRKRPDLSLDDFNEHWIGRHREVVLAQPDFVRFIRGYRQNHRVGTPCRTMTGEVVPETEAPAGAVELWFDSEEAAREAFGTTGYQVQVRADEPNAFLVGQGLACLVQPHLLLPE
jgi:hypothetical protein